MSTFKENWNVYPRACPRLSDGVAQDTVPLIKTSENTQTSVNKLSLSELNSLDDEGWAAKFEHLDTTVENLNDLELETLSPGRLGQVMEAIKSHDGRVNAKFYTDKAKQMGTTVENIEGNNIVVKTMLEQIMAENDTLAVESNVLDSNENKNKNKNKNKQNKNKNNRDTEPSKTGTSSAGSKRGPSYGELKRQLDALLPLVQCQADSLKTIDKLIDRTPVNQTAPIVSEPSDSSDEESSSEEIIIEKEEVAEKVTVPTIVVETLEIPNSWSSRIYGAYCAAMGKVFRTAPKCIQWDGKYSPDAIAECYEDRARCHQAKTVYEVVLKNEMKNGTITYTVPSLRIQASREHAQVRELLRTGFFEAKNATPESNAEAHRVYRDALRLGIVTGDEEDGIVTTLMPYCDENKLNELIRDNSNDVLDRWFGEREVYGDAQVIVDHKTFDEISIPKILGPQPSTEVLHQRIGQATAATKQNPQHLQLLLETSTNPLCDTPMVLEYSLRNARNRRAKHLNFLEHH